MPKKPTYRQAERQRIAQAVGERVRYWGNVFRTGPTPEYRLVLALKEGSGIHQVLKVKGELEYSLKLGPGADEETIDHEALHLAMSHARELSGRNAGLGPSQLYEHVIAASPFVEAHFASKILAGIKPPKELLPKLAGVWEGKMAMPGFHDAPNYSPEYASYRHYIGKAIAYRAAAEGIADPRHWEYLLLLASRQPYTGGERRESALPKELVEALEGYSPYREENLRTAKASFRALEFLGRIGDRIRKNPRLLERIANKVTWL